MLWYSYLLRRSGARDWIPEPVRFEVPRTCKRAGHDQRQALYPSTRLPTSASARVARIRSAFKRSVRVGEAGPAADARVRRKRSSSSTVARSGSGSARNARSSASAFVLSIALPHSEASGSASSRQKHQFINSFWQYK